MIVSIGRVRFASLSWRIVLAAIICAVSLSAAEVAAQSVLYDISFPNLVHHEAEVVVTFTGVPVNEPLEVRMSRTSPGRYALHEFARNVYNVRADDGEGRPLSIARPDLHQWSVSGHRGTVRVSYTLFGDRADGTYTGINNRYAHLNIPATFMWARGMQDVPVALGIDVPRDGWDVATQLFPAGDTGEYTAPNFWYFVDSPIHIGAIKWRSWSVEEANASYTIRLALDHDGSDEEASHFADLASRIVDEEISMWRDIPDFDSGTYTFIAVYLPSVAGDGMEHRNSTVLTYPEGFSSSMVNSADSWLDPLSTLSHEFFHAWNVERLRPRSLEPFDFESANVSRELWFAEGFTSYYDGLFVRRAGLISDSHFASSLSRAVDTAINAPGRKFFSPAEMSMQAPFVDAATAVDPDNRRNTFISYYIGGDALALGLDLEMRGRFGVSLDDFMRAMWDQYGRTETPYTLDDLQTVLGEVCRNEHFASDFFRRFVEGHEAMDYATLLAQAGFAVVEASPDKLWLGTTLDDALLGAVLTDEPLINSPLYNAGLESGTVILELDGHTVEGAAYVRGALDQRSAGDVVPIGYWQNGRVLRSELVLIRDPEVKVVLFEEVGRPVTDEMRLFRSRWLASQVPEG